jgi:hypothetical protein
VKLSEMTLGEIAAKAKELASAETVQKASEKAGSLASEHRGTVTTWVDKAGRTVDEKTQGRYTTTIDKVRAGVEAGLDKVTAHGSSAMPGGAKGPVTSTGTAPGGADGPAESTPAAKGAGDATTATGTTTSGLRSTMPSGSGPSGAPGTSGAAAAADAPGSAAPTPKAASSAPGHPALKGDLASPTEPPEAHRPPAV